MPKVIVFDWDGTLADSVSQIIKCKHFLAQKYDLPLPDETQIRHVLGTKFEDAMRICFPSATESVLKIICREFNSLMQQPEYQAELFSGAKELLLSLKKRGIKLAIATSKNRNELEAAIAYTDLSGLFDITCCGAEHKEKPDPAMLNHIMTTHMISPDECLMVGDTTTDIQFATNSGVKIICVTFGAHSREKLEALNPSDFITAFPELHKFIG